MLTYEDLKGKPKTLMAMTSLKSSEFDDLLIHFSVAWEEENGADPSKGGRTPVIAAMADRLLFILFYLKTYPLQEVIAHWFGMSKPQANFTIHQLAAGLGKALALGGHRPAQLTGEMLSRLEEESSRRA